MRKKRGNMNCELFSMGPRSSAVIYRGIGREAHGGFALSESIAALAAGHHGLKTYSVDIVAYAVSSFRAAKKRHSLGFSKD